jgi:hypothetical protein
MTPTEYVAPLLTSPQILEMIDRSAHQAVDNACKKMRRIAEGKEIQVDKRKRRGDDDDSDSIVTSQLPIIPRVPILLPSGASFSTTEPDVITTTSAHTVMEPANVESGAAVTSTLTSVAPTTTTTSTTSTTATTTTPTVCVNVKLKDMLTYIRTMMRQVPVVEMVDGQVVYKSNVLIEDFISYNLFADRPSMCAYFRRILDEGSQWFNVW